MYGLTDTATPWFTGGVKKLTVVAWNHHTPYWSMWHKALPDVRLHLLPTYHAPQGWRFDQRPIPEQVAILPTELWQAVNPDIVILQTASDLRRFMLDSDYRNFRGKLIYLAHNRAELDFPCGIFVERTPGQIKLVTISEMKAASYRNKGYSHPITVIPPYVDVEQYSPWIGDEPHILTVCNGIGRELFDGQAWLEATKGLPVRLVGSHNEGVPGAVGPAPSWEALKDEYRHARVYLSVNKWPNEDGYNLSLLEAMATGMACVCLSNETAPHDGVLSGHVPQALRSALEAVLRSSGHRRRLTTDAHASVAWRFPKERFAQAWSKVLAEVCNA